MSEDIRRMLQEAVQVQEALFDHVDLIQQIAATITAALRSGHKILLCGNGGSAADAQHVAAELLGRFARERASWPALALTTNSSVMTAVANDYDFDRIFARQVEGLAVAGDIVVGISTSGTSPNIIRALETARAKGCITIGFTGETGGRLKDISDLCFRAPSTQTPHTQEAHIVVWHVICELVERDLAAA
ncbi:MAG TPA: D-sedoheptulose 7-phosphate isomerase [Anaerolineae bacterium]|nr:D-sedoheptulose 7-phosphate isomerase [Anaerolineae bacterium]